MNNQHLTPPPANPQDDEIDLGELIAKLWQGRVLIAGVTVLSVAAAAGYAFTAKEEWTSQAIIEMPRLEALGDYYKAQMVLRRITGKSTETPEEISQDVFAEFIKQVNSPDIRRSYFSSTKYYNEANKGNTDSQAQRLALEKMVDEDLALIPPDGKKTIYNRIQMTANSAKDAQTLLTGYLNVLNQQVWATKVSEFNVRTTTLKLDLEKEMQDIRTDLNARDRSLLETTKRARDTAARGKIQTFRGSSYQAVPEADMLFLLGTQSLDARIATLETTTAAFPVRFYQAERKLQDLNALPRLTTDNKLSYRYLEAPTLPVQRNKPKRALIVALGAITGLMLGCVLVLGRDAFSALRQKIKG